MAGPNFSTQVTITPPIGSGQSPLLVYNDVSPGGNLIFLITYGGTRHGQLALYPNGGGTADILLRAGGDTSYINSGNVGIGTMTPDS